MAKDRDKKEIQVEGSAEVTGDVEGTVDVSATASFTPGEDEPESPDEFMDRIEGEFARYRSATRGAGRETAKATVPAAPAAVGSRGFPD